MPQLDIILEGDGAFADVPKEKLAHTTEPMRITALADGMISEGGRRYPSVAIGMFLPHGGGCVVGETSLKLFLTAADALKARYGDPRA
jgi:hypothetical protein